MAERPEQPQEPPAPEPAPAPAPAEPATSDAPAAATLLAKIAELEQRLQDTQLLKERVAELEQRRMGASLESIAAGLGELENRLSGDLGEVETRLKSIESRRDAWIRTLLLTLAAPLAAGAATRRRSRR